ncbi:MAG: hypothetical protein RR280_01075 [Bacteroidaceae bacterium]
MPLSSVLTNEQYAVASRSADAMEFFDRTGWSVKPEEANGEFLFPTVQQAKDLRQHLINKAYGTADDLFVVCHQTSFLTCEYKETAPCVK